ncbi:MAG: C4-type zinc ribbon domain-containing protein [Bacteroidales bacterium]|nr:C4-type zinc ribbon domain-containing protein [Bacteroidales bacterium]
MKETIEKAKASISKATMDAGDYSIEQKLVALFSLQLIDSEIDKIRIIRGELPLEVQDLEDEVAGLETRLNRFNTEIEDLEKQITERKTATLDAKAAIKKYELQQNKVRNNREYESLNKEIEYQSLEIQLQDKRIKEANWQLEQKKKDLEQVQETFEERTNDLAAKKTELDEIIAETEIEEKELLKVSNEHKKKIEQRLISSYDKVRENARNGLAVVVVERDACGGCFNKIPPQRQAEIKLHKKILVCEHCGRILVDEGIRKAVIGE